jgi:hypothetical protein
MSKWSAIMHQSSVSQQHKEGRGLATAALLLLVLIHRSAWKGDSANFAFWAFSEVRKENCNKYCNRVMRQPHRRSMVGSLREQGLHVKPQDRYPRFS